jgi:hypothetical protein
VHICISQDFCTNRAFIPLAFRRCAARQKKWFEKRADGCHREKSGGLQAGDARITIVTTQPSDFGEFEGRPFGVSFKRVGGGEPGMMGWGCRIGAVPSFEPADRLVDPRLRQMRLPNPVVP